MTEAYEVRERNKGHQGPETGRRPISLNNHVTLEMYTDNEHRCNIYRDDARRHPASVPNFKRKGFAISPLRLIFALKSS